MKSTQPAETGPPAELTDREKMRLLPWSYAHNALLSADSVRKE